MPKIIKKTIFALDIGDCSIEALELDSAKKVKAFGRVVLKEGIVKDGLILDKEKLVEKIKEVLVWARIESRKVIVSLPESKVFIHIFDVAEDLRGEELVKAIEGEAEKTIPLEPSETYWDSVVISSRSEKRLVLYVATLKKVVDSYLEVLDKAGLEPVAFDLESMALSRALLQEVKSQRKVMIVDIGARTSNISVFDKYSNKDIVLTDSITVPMAGNQWSRAIADELGVPFEEAETLKEKAGFDETKEKGRIALILQRESQPIIEKIKEVMENYDRKMEEVILVGGSAQTPKIADYFSSVLGSKVRVGVSPLVKELENKSILFNTVVGLALRAIEEDPKKAGINLLPKKEALKAKPSLTDKRIKGIKPFTFFLLVVFVILFVVLGWVVYFRIIK